jgi:hypothetical protein
VQSVVNWYRFMHGIAQHNGSIIVAISWRVFCFSGRTFRCCYRKAKSNFFVTLIQFLTKLVARSGDQFDSSKIIAYFILYATEVCPLLSRNVYKRLSLLWRSFCTRLPAFVKEFQFNLNSCKWNINWTFELLFSYRNSLFLGKNLVLVCVKC